MNNQTKKFFDFLVNLSVEHNIELNSSTHFLDLGASKGDIVRHARSNGLKALGADFYSVTTKDNELPEYCSRIIGDIVTGLDYKLPFDDDYFDVALSQNVFEHVMNYELTLAELSRVMKKGGISINLFPSRYRIIEPHVFIPGATIFQNAKYLRLWSWFSRKKFDDEYHSAMTDRQLAEKHNDFLLTKTNYMTKKDIYEISKNHFAEVDFIDKQFFKLWPGNISAFYPTFKFFPVLFQLHSTFRMRILLLQK